MNTDTQIAHTQPRVNSPMSLKALGKNEKLATYIYIIFSLVTISFFGMFAILPAFSTITSLRRQYDDNKLVVEALDKKLAALSSLDQQYQTLQADLPYVYNAIPSSAEIATVTRQIETIARDSGVIIDSFSTGSVEYYPLGDSKSELYSYSFAIEASGNEANIDTFINNIISFNRIVSIDRITSGLDRGDVFQTSIGGKVYFSKDI